MVLFASSSSTTKKFHGYYVVAATFVLNFVSLGTNYSSAEFVLPLEATFADQSIGTIDFFPTILLSSALFSSFGAGRMQEFLTSRGYSIEILFALGGICLAGGFFHASYARTLNGVLQGAVLTGMGIGLTGFTSAGVCVMWFEKNRGTMLLLAMSGSGIGNIVYSLGMQTILDKFAAAQFEDPWRPAMRISGLLSLVFSLCAASAMRLPKPMEVEKHESLSSTPLEASRCDKEDEEGEEEICKLIESMYGAIDNDDNDNTCTEEQSPAEPGHVCTRRSTAVVTLGKALKKRHTNMNQNQQLSLPPSKTASTANERPSMARKILQPHRKRSSIVEYEALAKMPVDYANMVKKRPTEPPQTTQNPIPGLPYLSLQEALLTRTTKSLIFWCLVSSFAFTNFYVQIPAFADSVGLSAQEGARALSLTGLGMLVGNMTLGIITDIIGPIRSLQITMTALVALVFIWPLCTTPTSLNVLSLLYGYMSTTQASVPLIIMADAFGETSPGSILTLLGILNVAKFPGYLFGPAINGSLFEYFGDYSLACVIAGFTMLAGVFFLYFIPSAEEQLKIIIKGHSRASAK